MANANAPAAGWNLWRRSESEAESPLNEQSRRYVADKDQALLHMVRQ
jgi:hypothetical protein